jgi:hypothetical protein
MLEEMVEYRKKVEKLLELNSPKTDWKGEMKFFEKKLNQLQMERLIHLIVTMTTGLAMLMSCLVSLVIANYLLYLLDVVLVVLFLAYIWHYMKLENLVQSCYPLLDKIKEK